MRFRSHVVGGAALLGLSLAAPACDLQFTQGGTSLTYPVPGTTTAITQFSFTNISDQPCTNVPGQQAGIVVNGVLNPSTGAVTGTSTAPFSLTAQQISPANALSCSIYAGPSVACQSSTIAPGASYTVQLSFTASGTIAPPYCFQGASFNQGVGNAFINPFTSPTGYDAITGCAGQTGGGGGNPLLIVTKRDLQDPVYIGDEIQYEITVRAQDSGVSPGPIVSDTLPPGVTYTGFSAPPGWNCTHNSGVVTCNTFEAFPSGTVANILLYVTADQVGTVVNGCTAIAPGGAGPPVDDSGCIEETTVLAIPSVDLNAVKTSNTPTVPAGGSLGYAIAVTNSGPDTAPAGSVVVTDTLPLGTSFVSANGIGWACVQSGGTVTCTLSGTLASGATAPPINITVQVPTTPGPITNTCVVEAGGTIDPTPGDGDCTETNTVLPPVVDLNAVKSSTTPTVPAGGTLVYTISVSNNGPGAAPTGSVVMTDTLPSGTAFQSASGTGWSCNNLGGLVTCTLAGALANGATAAPITISVQVPTTPGPITNTCVVDAAGTTDPSPSDPDCIETNTVLPPVVDLNAVKSSTTPTVPAGGTLTYTIAVTNNGPGAAPAGSVVVTDNPPSGTTFQSATGPGWACSHGAGIVTCTLSGSLASGATAAEISLAVTVPVTPGPITNTCVVSASGTSDPTPADPDCDETNTVLPPVVDLNAVKSSTTPTVPAGGTLTYTVAVTNNGPGAAPAGSVVVTDTLPAGTTFQSATGPGWACSHASGTVTCTLSGGLASGATATAISIAVQVPTTPGPITNTCVVDAAGTTDPTPSDPDCTETNTVQPPVVDLDAVKSSTTPTVPAGGTLVYTISVSNNGPGGAPAGSVVITDTLPAGTSFQSATGTGWSCVQSSGTVTCTLSGALASGAAAAPINISVQVPTTAGPITNTCVVAAAGTTDPTPADPDCSETNNVDPRSDLSIDKTDAVDPVAAGSGVTYQLAVTNLGPSAAASVVVSDTLPSGTTYQAASGTGWSCSHSSGTVTCSRATAALGAQPAITVEVLAPAAAGAIVNAANVTSTTVDPVPENNSDTETTQVTGVSGLAISKTDSVDPVQAAAAYSYTLGVTNLGPSAAVNAVVTDTLPAGVVFVSAAGTGWSCSHNSGTVTCTRSSLAVGASSIVVNVNAPAIGGTVLNTATVASDTPDGNPADNTATEPTAVLAASDLDVVKSVAPNPARVGQVVTFGFALSNAGPSPATGVQLVDQLPAQFAYQGFTGTGWSCSHAAGTVTCSLSGSVAAGASAAPLSITTTAIAAGTYTNLCVATADAPDIGGTPACRVDGTVNPPSVDLDAVKSSTTPTVPAGGTLPYSIVVTNNGPDAAPAGSVVITDTLPASTTFQAASGVGWSCSHAAGTVTCTLAGSLASGAAAAPVTVTVQVPSTPGPITNTCVVEASGTTDPSPADPDCIETNTVQPPVVDLDAVKSSTTPTVPAGGSLVYSITVTNNGPGTAPAGSVMVTDSLPAGTTFQSAAGTGWTCVPTSGTVTCTLSGSLASGATASPISITVQVPTTPGPITNTCVVEATGTIDPSPADPDCTETNTVQPPVVDLQAVKSSTTPTVPAGGTLTYTIAVSNNGPGDAPAGSVRVTDTLPAGTSFQAATGAGWSCTHAAGTVTCTLSASLASGAAATPISISVQVPTTPGPITNTCVVEAGGTTDPSPADPDCEETNTVQPPVVDLNAVKSSTTPTVAPGGTLVYTIAVVNNGPGAAPAGTVVVTDTLPAGTTFQTAAGTGWACSHASGTVTCTLSGGLASGAAAAPISISVQVPTTPGPITNTCVVDAAGTTDPTPADPDCTETNTVQPPVVDLSAVKSSSTPVVPVGGTLVYTIDVVNNGPGAAPAGSVTVTDTLPAGTAFQTATGTGWSCVHSNGTVTCTLSGGLAGGASAPPISLSVQVPTTPGPITNTCVVEAGDTTDPTPADPDCTETNTVSPLVANIDIVKTASPNVVGVGQPVTFGFGATNVGPDPATGIRFVDEMPAAFQIVSAAGQGWNCQIESQTVTCSMTGRLAVGESAPVVLIETIAQAPGQHENVCVGAADQVDQDGTPSCETVVTVTPAEAIQIPSTSRLTLLILILGMVGVLATVKRR